MRKLFEVMGDTDNRISIVIDPSHARWVLGGLFREMAASSKLFFREIPIEIPAPKNLGAVKVWLDACFKIRDSKILLFTSLTPLENYMKFPLKSMDQRIGLWFTHKEGEFTKSELQALRRTNHIFVHSRREIENLQSISNARITVLTGAINSNRFYPQSVSGEEIAWVGTPTPRKRPELLFQIAKKLPDVSFKVLGPGWKESKYWELVKEIKNISVVDLNGAMTSRDLDGCSIFLMTSHTEGGPMPLLEAIGSGLFPIVTDAGFARDVLSLAEVPEEFVLHPQADLFVAAIVRAKELIKAGFSPNRERVLDLTFEKMANLVISSLIKN